MIYKPTGKWDTKFLSKQFFFHLHIPASDDKRPKWMAQKCAFLPKDDFIHACCRPNLTQSSLSKRKLYTIVNSVWSKTLKPRERNMCAKLLCACVCVCVTRWPELRWGWAVFSQCCHCCTRIISFSQSSTHSCLAGRPSIHTPTAGEWP